LLPLIFLFFEGKNRILGSEENSSHKPLWQDSQRINLKLITQIGGSPVSLVVCGGTALFTLGLVLRTTKDIDVLGTVSKDHGIISVRKIDKFPDFLIKASKIVQQDFRLPAHNKGN
jgi:hypothetical protein